MIRLKLSLLLCCMILFSMGCKQKTDKQPLETVEEKILDSSESEKFFSLTLKAVVKEEDVFSLFYIQFEGEAYSGEKIINTKVYPSDEMQEIKFELPEADYPYNIRLDFGSNPSQENIIIAECDLNYFNSSYKIKGSELYKYFKFNGGVEMLADSLTFKLSTVIYDIGEKFDPYIVGNDRCVNVLQTEI